MQADNKLMQVSGVDATSSADDETNCLAGAPATFQNLRL